MGYALNAPTLVLMLVQTFPPYSYASKLLGHSARKKKKSIRQTHFFFASPGYEKRRFSLMFGSLHNHNWNSESGHRSNRRHLTKRVCLWCWYQASEEVAGMFPTTKLRIYQTSRSFHTMNANRTFVRIAATFNFMFTDFNKFHFGYITFYFYDLNIIEAAIRQWKMLY